MNLSDRSETITLPTENYQNYIKHLASISEMYDKAPKRSDGWVYDAEAEGILARAESAIRKICGADSSYIERMTKTLDSLVAEHVKADRIVGIVRALKGDLEDGYLHTFPELVRGEMFESLNEMAKHLLEEGYKDAAAVIAGSSLESHLRQLCVKHGIPLNHIAQGASTKPKKAVQLNQDLRNRSVYSLFDQKQITAWLDLRNNAAHGQYSAYDEHQVAKLIEWVDDFISKNPA